MTSLGLSHTPLTGPTLGKSQREAEPYVSFPGPPPPLPGVPSSMLGTSHPASLLLKETSICIITGTCVMESIGFLADGRIKRLSVRSIRKENVGNGLEQTHQCSSPTRSPEAVTGGAQAYRWVIHVWPRTLSSAHPRPR